MPVYSSAIKLSDSVKKRNLHILLFCVFASLILHLPYILPEGYSFAYVGTDAQYQMLPFQLFLRSNWEKGNFFWSWSYGLGGNIYSEFSYYYSTSIFFWIKCFTASILNIDWSDIGTLLTMQVVFSIIKQSLSMLFFYLLVSYEKNRAVYLNLIGAMAYGFSMWFIRYSVWWDFNTDIMVWLPLTLLGILKYKKEKKPLLLIISFSILIVNNVYYAVDGCIVAGLYILLFYCRYNARFKEYCSDLFRIFRVLLLSLLLSAVLFLPSAIGFLNAGRGMNAASFSMIPSLSIIKSIFLQLFIYSRDHEGLMTTLPYCFSLLLLIPIRNASSLLKKKLCLSGIVFFIAVVPVLNSLMSLGSYVSTRWYFILVFAFSYLMPDILNELSCKRPLLKGSIIAVGVLGLYVYYRHTLKGDISGYESIAAICGIVSIFIIMSLKFISNKNVRSVLITALIIVCLAESAAHGYGYVNLKPPTTKSDNINDYIYKVDVSDEKKIHASDDSFYRIDNRMPLDAEHRNDNQYLLYGNDFNGLSSYNSMINQNLQSWFREDHNVYMWLATPSYYHRMDDRLFLDTLWNVKYKIGDKSYGYSQTDIAEDVYVSDNPVGIDLWYDSAISESKFKKMNASERDAIILQSAVCDDLSIPEAAEYDDVTSTQNIDFHQAVLTNCTYQNGELTVGCEDPDGIGTIKCEVPVSKLNALNKRGELLLEIELDFDEDSRGKRLFNTDVYAYQVSVNGKSTRMFIRNYPWYYYSNKYVFKLDAGTEEIAVDLTPGVYRIADCKVSFNSYEKYKKWVEDRNRYNLEDLSVDNGRIDGRIFNKERGLLVFSSPYDPGWRCFVDGKPAKVYKVNNAMCGIELDAGEHVVKMVFIPGGMLLGLLITLVTIILVMVTVYEGKESI